MTRGERIKRARTMRRPKMSQLELANATGVGMRTIGRIEAGEAEESPSLDVLEAFFGLSQAREPTEREGTASANLGGLSAGAAGRTDAGSDNPRLKQATVMELLAEIAVRFAHLERERTPGRPPTLPQHSVDFYTEDAPSATRERAGRGAERGEAL